MTTEELIADGYMSVSNKYRHVAKLPLGETGVQALSRVCPDAAKDIADRIEQQSANTYRRCYTERDGNMLELSIEEYSDFRKSGGRSSW